MVVHIISGVKVNKLSCKFCINLVLCIFSSFHKASEPPLWHSTEWKQHTSPSSPVTERKEKKALKARKGRGGGEKNRGCNELLIDHVLLFSRSLFRRFFQDGYYLWCKIYFPLLQKNTHVAKTGDGGVLDNRFAGAMNSALIMFYFFAFLKCVIA